MRAGKPVWRDAKGVALTLGAAVGALSLFAPVASATFHLMNVREVYPGSTASPGAEYVELQMYTPGQNLVGGHILRTYNAAGAIVKANTVPADVSSGANQATILLATPEAESQFSGVVADAPLSPSDQLSPTGGAVCWEAIDCVSWGNFSGSLPSPPGTPAASSGIPDEMALRRTIAPGCSTLLELSDDRDNSAADFSAVFPSPRPNSVSPSEHTCSGSGPQSQPEGGGAAGSALQTMLRGKPAKKTRDRTPTFRFSAEKADARFECKLDGSSFKACRSPFTARRLRLGAHTFRVRALDDSGELRDPSPASYNFRVIAKRR